MTPNKDKPRIMPNEAKSGIKLDLAEPRKIHLQTPLCEADVESLRMGDAVYLSGIIYTARDAAHKRLVEMLDKGEPLPFDPVGAVIYYTGPTPPPPGFAIGAVGPTTSYRMDSYAPRLYAAGVKASMGKGLRAPEVKAAMREHKAVYLGATGGAGALLSLCVKQCRVIAFAELGPEAIHELIVENFPALVINDAHGGELYATPKI